MEKNKAGKRGGVEGVSILNTMVQRQCGSKAEREVRAIACGQPCKNFVLEVEVGKLPEPPQALTAADGAVHWGRGADMDLRGQTHPCQGGFHAGQGEPLAMGCCGRRSAPEEGQGRGFRDEEASEWDFRKLGKWEGGRGWWATLT